MGRFVPEGMSYWHAYQRKLRVDAANAETRAKVLADLMPDPEAVIEELRSGTTAAERAAEGVSMRIYENQRALWKFAERVRDGALGKFNSWVYFIGRVTDGAIKIGLAENPRVRLAGLQVGCPEPLELIVAVKGDEGIEKLLHRAFKPDRIRGEWFRRSEVISEFIRVVKLRKARYPKG